MLRRLPESHKRNASKMVPGVLDSSYDPLYDPPHDEKEVSQINRDIALSAWTLLHLTIVLSQHSRGKDLAGSQVKSSSSGTGWGRFFCSPHVLE
jgi:hypothetical protein